jgi:TonB family protein
MKGSGQEFSVWTPRRFLGVVGSLFFLQAGLIALFGARGAKPGTERKASTQFRAVGELSQEQLRRLFFASDPAVFVLPSAHGFSGRAWMDQPPAHYQSTNQVEAPRWLALDASRLGTGPALLEDSDATAPLLPARLEIPQLEPLPVFLSPVNIPTQSVFRIDGDLAKRLIGPAPALHAWPSPDNKLLANTIVQIAVNPGGDVLAARLLNRSGSAEADADAVAKTSALRFRPAAQPGTIWTQAVFRWQTTFPAAPETQP